MVKIGNFYWQGVPPSDSRKSQGPTKKSFDFKEALDNYKKKITPLDIAETKAASGTATPKDLAKINEARTKKRAEQEKIMKDKKSSTGLTYEGAKKIIANLQKKYNPVLKREFPLGIDYRYDSSNLPDRLGLNDSEKEQLRLANEAMSELEQKYGLTGILDMTFKSATNVDDGLRFLYTSKETGYAQSCRNID